MKLLKGIKIEKIWYGWIGLARMSDGKRILIKWGALPGSVVDLRIVKQKKDFIEAHIFHIHKHDPKLVDGKVFCPHFFRMEEEEESKIVQDGTKSNKVEENEGRSEEWNDNSKFWILNSKSPRKVGCGGCKWQMLSYPTQLKLKQDIVLDSFKKLSAYPIEIRSIIGSPLEKWYRNKIEFSFGKYITNSSEWWVTSEGKKNIDILSDRSIGFHRQWEFSKIVDIDSCGLISDKANEIFAYIKWLCFASGLPVYDQKTHQGFFRHLVIRQGFHTNQFLVNLSVSGDNLQDSTTQLREKLLTQLKSDSFLQEQITTFVITHNDGLADIIKSPLSETKILRWEGYMYEQLLFDTKEGKDEKAAVSFRISPFSFFQTNTVGAQQLFALAMQMAGKVEGTILDLYCGTWSIGLSFLKAGMGDFVIGIEIVEEAITDARHNAKINGLENQVLFIANPAEKELTTHDVLKDKIETLWLVIVDPPRDGLHKNVISFLGKIKKERDFKLVYISCNPVTMVRDLELFHQEGFTTKTIQPVDMFPQTHHIEVIGILE